MERASVMVEHIEYTLDKDELRQAVADYVHAHDPKALVRDDADLKVYSDRATITSKFFGDVTSKFFSDAKDNRRET